MRAVHPAPTPWRPRLRLALLPLLRWLAGVAPDWLHGWPAALPVFGVALELCVSAGLALAAFFKRSWRTVAIEQAIGALTFVALGMALSAMFDAWHGDKAGRAQMDVAFTILGMLSYWRYAVVALASAVLTLLVARHASLPANPGRDPE